MDLNTFIANSVRKRLLSAKNIKEELNKLTDELLFDILRLPDKLKPLEPILDTFVKAKLYYLIEENTIRFGFFKDEPSDLLSSFSRHYFMHAPSIEVSVSPNFNLNFEFKRLEDGTIDLDSIKQSFSYDESKDNSFTINDKLMGSADWKV